MTQTHPRLICCGPRGTSQRGAALIVSLILLMVMTLIGVFAMRGTTLEERMAGNMRDRSLAFEAGESGLRDAETYLQELDSPIDFEEAPPGGGGLYHYSDDNRPRRPADVPEGDWRTANTNSDNISQPPEYVIEQLYFVPPPPDADEIGSLDPTTGTDEEDDQLFRVHLRAWGGSQSGPPQVLLESRFRP